MKRVIAICVSVLIMVAIFMKIDIRQFVQVVKDTDILLFLVACLFFIPQIFLVALRWSWITKKSCTVSLKESIKLVLAASSLNLILPSKMGDLSKAYFLKKQGSLGLTRGLNLVLYEKLMDVGSLCVFVIIFVVAGVGAGYLGKIAFLLALVILCLYPIAYILPFERFADKIGTTSHLWGKVGSFLRDTHEAIQEVKREKSSFFVVLAVSLFLWFVHLSQFLIFFRAIHSEVPVSVIFSLTPIAIFIGILPITIAGIGTRDAAFIFLFSKYEPASVMISVGLFATFRYIVCGILGLPFFNQYMVHEGEKR